VRLPLIVRQNWLEILLLSLLITTAGLPIPAAALNGAMLRGVSDAARFSGGPDPADSRAMDVRIASVRTQNPHAANSRAADVRAATIRAAKVRAIYLPPTALTDRRINALIQYAGQLPVNGVVMHVKDPFGRLSWRSAAPLASNNGTQNQTRHLINTLKRLKENKIWTIAKLDCFADHALVSNHPDMGLIHKATFENWKDKNGLYWVNPYDERVWDYLIRLASELAELGVDEVQFDYVRFPSDGDLTNIDYPRLQAGLTRAACIGRFLEKAYAELKPMGVIVSADIFGLTAWKTDDFGVGQVLEAMVSHLDVVCPMFYPSHFPRGFLGKQSPGDYPREIMARSMANIQRRTDKIVRPWIQGFWYQPEKITAQIDGIEAEAASTWAVWNPGGSYGLTYRALAARSGVSLSAPTFYPSLADLRNSHDRITVGHHTVINYTNFRKGYSILSLETSRKNYRSPYTSPMAMLATLDEGVMDHILCERGIAFGRMTSPKTKAVHLARLFCSDLDLDPRRLRPAPYLIDWENGSRFSAILGQEQKRHYQAVVAAAMTGKPGTYLSYLEPPERNLWLDLQ
jgi:hypothetical protein